MLLCEGDDSNCDEVVQTSLGGSFEILLDKSEREERGNLLDYS